MLYRDSPSFTPIALLIELVYDLHEPHCSDNGSQDICDSNMLVSCYRQDRIVEQFMRDLSELRREDHVRYAFMDYDQSIQLPLDVSVKECRRPSSEAWVGWDFYKPLDVWLGESRYNPFAFDVGMLGNMFRVYLAVRMRPNPSFTLSPIHAPVLVLARRKRSRCSQPCRRCSTG